MKIFINLLIVFILVLFGCSSTKLPHHYILYDYSTCNPQPKNGCFLVTNDNKSVFYEKEDFNEYLACLELSGNELRDKCDILGRTFADEDTIESIREGNCIFHFLKVFENRIIDTIRDGLDSGSVMYQYVMIDTVWQKVFSFVKNDTINIPKFIYNSSYSNTVYTGIDSEFVVSNKVYNCGKFIVNASNCGITVLFIEKNSGIEFLKLEMWSDERIKRVQSDTNFDCKTVNPIIFLKVKDIIPVKRKYRKKDFGKIYRETEYDYGLDR